MIMEAASVGSSHHPEGLETKTLKLLNLGCSEEKPPSTENQTWSKDGSLGGIRRAALGAPEILQTGCGSCPGRPPAAAGVKKPCQGEEAFSGCHSQQREVVGKEPALLPPAFQSSSSIFEAVPDREPSPQPKCGQQRQNHRAACGRLCLEQREDASCLHRYKLGHSTYQCNFPFPPTPLLGLSCHFLAPFPSGILLGVCGAGEVPRSVSAIVRMPLVCRFQRYPYLQVSDWGCDDLGCWSHLALFTNSSSSSGLF